MSIVPRSYLGLVKASSRRQVARRESVGCDRRRGGGKAVLGEVGTRSSCRLPRLALIGSWVLSGLVFMMGERARKASNALQWFRWVDLAEKELYNESVSRRGVPICLKPRSEP